MKRVCYSDLKNNKPILDIEAGCYGGSCACVGSCLRVIGKINREDYLRFIKVFNPTPKQIDYYLSLL